MSFRPGALRDAGMVPLSSRETAKGGEKETQLAALRQVFPLLQRSHPGAKRNQIPGSGTPARILTTGDWLYKKEKKHLFGVRMRQKCGWELRELKDGFY